MAEASLKIILIDQGGGKSPVGQPHPQAPHLVPGGGQQGTKQPWWQSIFNGKNRPQSPGGGAIPAVPITPRVGPQSPGGGAIPAVPKPAGGISSLLSIGNLGTVLRGGAVVGAITLLGKAAKAAGDGLADLGKDLAKYSPELAAASARSDIRDMMHEMKRAERLGPDLSQFEDTYSKLMNSLYDIGTEVLAAILKIFEIFAPILQAVADGVLSGLAILEAIFQALKGIADWLVSFLTFGFVDLFKDTSNELFAKAEAALKRAFDKKDDDLKASDPFFDELMGLMGKPEFFGG